MSSQTRHLFIVSAILVFVASVCSQDAGIQVTGTEYVDRGSAIQLICNATGRPEPPHNVDWYKDGEKINSDAENGILITKKIEPSVLISMLVIRSSQMNDSGVYVCQSSFGDTAMITVHVLNVPSTVVKRGADQIKRMNKRATREYTVTSIESAPWLMTKYQDPSSQPLVGNDRYEGFCVDMMREIFNLISINYTIRLVADARFGSKLADGTWNGMMGELTRREADIAVAPLTISSLRERVVDFAPFMQTGITILIKKPDRSRHGQPLLAWIFEPFSCEVWIGLLCTFVVVGFVTFLVARISPVERKQPNGDNFTLLNSFWYTLRSMLHQGPAANPRSVALRILSAVWWFFALVVLVCYVANLVTLLTPKPRTATLIKSADDLSKQTEIKYGTLESGSTTDFFKTSKISVYKRMWSFMSSAEPSVFVGSYEEGVQRVRESGGKYALLMESTYARYHTQRKPCDVMTVGGNLDSKTYGVATPIGSQHRDRIRIALLELRERNVLPKLEKKWWYDKGECQTPKSPKGSSDTTGRTLASIKGLFLLLFLGLLLSLVVAVVEMLIASLIDSRRTKTSFSQVLQSNVRQICKSSPTTNEPVSHNQPADEKKPET